MAEERLQEQDIGFSYLISFGGFFKGVFFLGVFLFVFLKIGRAWCHC